MSAGDAREIRARVNRGLAWIGAASTVVSLLDIVTLLIVLGTGWVTEEQYGVQALAYTLFPVLELAADLGIGAAVIQRDDHTEEKLSTVFWFNLLLSAALFGLLCLIGPLLGALHGHAVVGWLLIAFGTKLLYQNVYVIPYALMRRQLRFGELSGIRVIANLAEAGVKIAVAFAGYPIWCFTIGALSRVALTGILIQWRMPWRPRFVFRPREAWDYVRFGLRQSGSQILYHVYTNLDYQVVGYYFGHAALGLYTLAYQIVLDPVRVISNVVIEVAFPAFSRLRHDAARVVDQLVAFTRLNLITVLPFMALILLSVDDFMVVFLGQDYLAGADAARVLCLVGLLRALSFIGPPCLDGMGRPELTLRYMVVASLSLTGLFIASAHVLGPSIGFVSVAWAWAAGYPIAFAALAWMTVQLIQLPMREYARRTWGVAACSVIAGCAAAVVRLALPGLERGPRLALVVSAFLAVLLPLLWVWQDVTLRTIREALRKPS